MIAVLAWFGALSVLACTLIVVWAALVLYVRHRHHRKAAEFVAALYEAIDRHPAGSRVIALPAYAPCGAWIGLSADGWWDLQFKAIAHVDECATCQMELERKAA